MKFATNVTLFPEETKTGDDFFKARMIAFVADRLAEVPSIITEGYNSTDAELLGRRPAGVRRNSRPVRVNEKIAERCSDYFGGNYREVSHGKFMLYFPDVCQIHIVKTNKGKLPPRTTKTAIDQTMQASLPFPGCPILHIGREVQYGRVGVNIMYYRNGICSWNIPFSAILASNDTQQISKPSVTPDESEVFATPKRRQKRKLEIA